MTAPNIPPAGFTSVLYSVRARIADPTWTLIEPVNVSSVTSNETDVTITLTQPIPFSKIVPSSQAKIASVDNSTWQNANQLFVLDGADNVTSIVLPDAAIGYTVVAASAVTTGW